MRQTVGSCQTLRHARVPLAGEACPRAQASPAKGTGGSGDKNDTEMNSTMSPPQSFPRLSGKNRTNVKRES